MQERNKTLQETIERIRDREFKEAAQAQSLADMAKDNTSVDKKWINAMRNTESAPLRMSTEEIPMSVMGTPLP